MQRGYDGAFKTRVAPEVLKEERTLARIAPEFVVHPNQIRQWRQRLLDGLPKLFSDRRKKLEKDSEDLQAELYRQIGQLKVEVDWLKKIPDTIY